MIVGIPSIIGYLIVFGYHLFQHYDLKKEKIPF